MSLECNKDGCTNRQVADWGVCGECFAEKSREMADQIISETEEE